MIKDIDINNRPREKALREGIKNLSNEELVAILISKGTKNNSALDIAKSLLEKYGSLSNLLNCDIYSLMSMKGIKKAKAILIMTIAEISKRANNEGFNYSRPVSKAEDVYLLVKTELENEKQEKFLVIYLNIKLRIIKKEILFTGGETSSYIDKNMIFKNAISCGAKNIICVHNHPSGEIMPSDEDILLTRGIVEISKITKINFVDHLIIGKNNYFSFKKSGII